MIAANGKNAPAPWVPFTRAGCDVGGVGTANIELENATADVPVVFGANSLEEAEVKANPNLANADFIGIAVHCATNSDLCKAGHSKPDLLPDEPGNPTISPACPATKMRPSDQSERAADRPRRRRQRTRTGTSVSRLRRHGAQGLTGVCRGDAGTRYTHHVQLRLGCARAPW